MRLLFFPLLLCTLLALATIPTQAQGSGDASDAFFEVFNNFKRAEKLEASNPAAALGAFKEVSRALENIKSRYPGWNPTIVDYRRQRTGEKIAELQGKTGVPAPPEAGGTFEPPLPGEEPSLIPNVETAPPPAPNRARKPSKGSDAPSSGGDPIQEIQNRMTRLQRDLEISREELDRMRVEKEKLGSELSETSKARNKAEEQQKVLQSRADNAEGALQKSLAEGTKGGDSLKRLQAERDRAKKDLRDVQIEREAADEVRQQVADRLNRAQTRVAELTKERDSNAKATTDASARVAAAEKKVEVAVKETADLNTRLTKVTLERNEALAQVQKMKTAQKDLDKLITENGQLMAKLGEAEKQIGQFKLEGAEKDRTIATLKTDLGSVQTQLAESQRQSQTYQVKMGDMQTQLDTTAQQLKLAMADNTTGQQERKKMQEENDLLRGIVLRQMKEQARRDQTRKLVLGELAKLEVKSKDLLTQINYLGQPVVKLTEKESALFKKPQIEINEGEISIAAPAVEEPAVAAAPVAPVPPERTEATRPSIEPPLPTATAAITPPAVPVPVPVQVEIPPAPVLDSTGPLTLDVPGLNSDLQIASNKMPAGITDLIPSAPRDALPARSTEPKGGEVNSLPGGDPALKSGGMPAELLPIVQEAKDAFERGKYREAEKLYERILQKAPSNLYALSNLGVVRFRSGKLKLAEDAFRKAIAVAPEDAFSHCTLGIVFYSQGKYDEAVNELTKALAINPKNATAHNYLGITASQKGWQEAAQKELETACSIDPTYADAHFNLAVVFATQQPPNKENARKYYKKAVDLGAEADSALEQLLK